MHQVLILKQSLNDFRLEKTISDHFSEIYQITDVNEILQQQNKTFSKNNASRNVVIQLLIKNQDFQNKTVCNH